MRWVTQERLQVDRLASAWLIRRFVNPEAEFAFVSRGTEAGGTTDGIPVHLRGSDLARQEERSTFEAIARTSPLLDAMDAALHERRQRSGPSQSGG